MLSNLFNRKSGKLIKSSQIYISNSKSQLIIAPQFRDKSGLIIEQEECFAYEYPIDSTKLGYELFRCLNLFYYKNQIIRFGKTSDWPAYKHSKCKTIKAFEKEYICMFVSSVNESNIILEISGNPYRNSLLTINSTISCYLGGQLNDKKAKELGNRIELVYQACINKSFD